MSQKQQTFRKVTDSEEILNLSFNFLSRVLTVKRKITTEELKKAQFGANEYYENFYGVPEETWYDMLEMSDGELDEYIEKRIVPIFKHKILGGD